jgi:hypothetical protein
MNRRDRGIEGYGTCLDPFDPSFHKSSLWLQEFRASSSPPSPVPPNTNSGKEGRKHKRLARGSPT